MADLLRAVLWLAFTCLLFVSGHRLLWACTVSPDYWPAALAQLLPETCSGVADDISRNRERLSDIAASVRQAESAVLMKAANCTVNCPPPPPPPPPSPPPEPSPPPPRLGEIMPIPLEGNLDSLMGCWQSTSKITNTADGVEIVHKYCFEPNGKGTLTITAAGYRCSPAISGAIAGERLRITVPRVPCNNGTTFNRSVIQCRPGNSGALCDIDSFDASGRATPARVRGGQFKRVE